MIWIICQVGKKLVEAYAELMLLLLLCLLIDWGVLLRNMSYIIIFKKNFDTVASKLFYFSLSNLYNVNQIIFSSKGLIPIERQKSVQMCAPQNLFASEKTVESDHSHRQSVWKNRSVEMRHPFHQFYVQAIYFPYHTIA